MQGEIRPKVVFIGGKLRADTPWGYELNVRLAEEVAVRLWQVGASVICPHVMARFMYGAAPDEYFTRGLREQLRRSDALLLLPNWRSSTGTIQEKRVAEDEKKEIFYIRPENEAAGSRGLPELEKWVQLALLTATK